MCKFKDTNLGIKKLDFGVKRGAMAVFLTDGREVIVPISMFPDIKSLSKKQREDYMIMAADGFIALATLGLAISYWAGFQDKILLLVVLALFSKSLYAL